MQIPVIRPIKKKDNAQIAKIIRSVLEDFGVPKIGTAYADTALDAMFENYDTEGAAYFVLEEHGKLIGGGGVAQLDNYEGSVCELQKMYFLPVARGRGLGTKMIDTCLLKASELGYEKCYLETMSYMEAAQKLYQRYGFQYLDGPMGDTGHYACGVHMIKDLEA
jgi:putative acetyltransferase